MQKVALNLEQRQRAVLSIALAFALIVSGLLALAAPTLAQDDTPDPNRGILVAMVQPDSPADEAGIVRGDILQAVNEEPVDLVPDLMQMLQAMDAGDEVELTVLHGDELRILTATLGESGSRAYLGITPVGTGPTAIEGLGGQPFQMPAPDMRQMPEDFTMRLDSPGARIVEVVPDSPADEAGLQPGDIIVAVEGQELTAANELADIIASYAPGDEVTLEIQVAVEDAGSEMESESEASEDADATEADEENADAEDADTEGADTEDADTEDANTEAVEIFEVVVTLGENDEGNAFLGVQYAPVMGMRGFNLEQLPSGEGFRFFRGPDGEGQFELPEGFEMPEAGMAQEVMVMQVAPDSPAAEAGLAEGDVIVAFDGEAIDSPEALVEAVSQRAAGDEVTLTIRSEDGEEMDLVVVLGENEEGNAFLGISIGAVMRSELSDEEGFAPGMRFRNGENADELQRHFFRALPESIQEFFQGESGRFFFAPDQAAPDTDVRFFQWQNESI